MRGHALGSCCPLLLLTGGLLDVPIAGLLLALFPTELVRACCYRWRGAHESGVALRLLGIKTGDLGPTCGTVGRNSEWMFRLKLRPHKSILQCGIERKSPATFTHTFCPRQVL